MGKFKSITLIAAGESSVTGDLVFEHDVDFVVAVGGVVASFPKSKWHKRPDMGSFDDVFGGMFSNYFGGKP